MVDFADDPPEAAFRFEVSTFVTERCPRPLIEDAPFAATLGAYDVGRLRDDERDALMSEWRAALVERGWIAPHWPREYGGADLTPKEQFILNSVMAEMRAPSMSVPNAGATLLLFGTDEQKRRYLPPMVSGEETWCHGASEPGAGSDLASLSTRAVVDGDSLVVNGSKIWTSSAWGADMMNALVRTDPDAPKHRGITWLLIDMHSPGVRVQPVVQMTENRRFNQVFFDDVRVPLSNVVGEMNRGWYIEAAHLDHERSQIGGGTTLRASLADLLDFLQIERDQRSARQHLELDPIRHRLADCAIAAEIAVLLSYRVISMQARGLIPNYEASITKVFRTELSQRVANAAVLALGAYGLLLDPDGEWVPMRSKWSLFYMSSAGETIGAGTSEIQRNVIATRGLGLPRG